MRIKNNVSAINSSRNHGIVQGQMDKTLEKLASGYKINRAGDNAAGLAISEGMRQQINGLDQAMRNINDGVGMTSTGEGALAEVHSMLHRMKTLAIQSANGTYSTAARANIEAERIQLLEEIDRISGSTDFNNIPLFNNKVPADRFPINPPEKQDDITLQVGHTAQETLDVERFYIGSQPLKLDETDFTDLDRANQSVDIIDGAIRAVTTVRSSFGASENHLNHTFNNLGVTKENMTNYESGIRDTNVAEEFTKFTSLNIVGQAAQSMQAHANSMPEMILQLLQA